MQFAMSISELDRSFLAGFLEGEATLGVHEVNGGQSLSCAMTLKQRDDEQDTLEWLLATTGVGRLYRVPARSTSKPQIAWAINTQEDCCELLALIEPCEFHGRRAAELRLWRRAVTAWTELAGADRRSTLRGLKEALAAARRFGAGSPSATPFTGHRSFLGYISGFTCAEGCFGMSDGRPRFAIHMRQDDRPLLDLLATTTGFGSVTEHRPTGPLNPSSTWSITGREQLAELRQLLWRGGLCGRKLKEMEIWATALDELRRAAGLRERPRRDRLQRARERLVDARSYRPPQRTDLLRLPGRDPGAQSIDALTEWSRVTTGALSCLDYMRWRREHPGTPARTTIVRRFGSWHAALEAAGLGDRVARAPRPAGGEARRQERWEAQRARVIAAVRRFERERGRLPRAVEFFRWRYEASVDVPTQGRVYRLFPGGWAEVLERARQAAGATV